MKSDRDEDGTGPRSSHPTTSTLWDSAESGESTLFVFVGGLSLESELCTTVELQQFIRKHCDGINVSCHSVQKSPRHWNCAAYTIGVPRRLIKTIAKAPWPTTVTVRSYSFKHDGTKNVYYVSPKEECCPLSDRDSQLKPQARSRLAILLSFYCLSI